MEVALQIDLVRGGSLQPAFAVSCEGPLFRAGLPQKSGSDLAL